MDWKILRQTDVFGFFQSTQQYIANQKKVNVTKFSPVKAHSLELSVTCVLEISCMYVNTHSISIHTCTHLCVFCKINLQNQAKNIFLYMQLDSASSKVNCIFFNYTGSCRTCRSQEKYAVFLNEELLILQTKLLLKTRLICIFCPIS